MQDGTDRPAGSQFASHRVRPVHGQPPPGRWIHRGPEDRSQRIRTTRRPHPAGGHAGGSQPPRRVAAAPPNLVGILHPNDRKNPGPPNSKNFFRDQGPMVSAAILPAMRVKR
jgi:hypothetical protein